MYIDTLVLNYAHRSSKTHSTLFIRIAAFAQKAKMLGSKISDHHDPGFPTSIFSWVKTGPAKAPC